MSLTTPAPVLTERVLTTSDEHRLVIRNRWLMGAALFFAAAFAILSAFMFLGFGTNANTRLIDDLAAAWSANDPDALADVYAADAVFTDSRGFDYVGIDAITDLATSVNATTFEITRVGDVIEVDGTLVAHIDHTMGAFEGSFLSVFEVEDGMIVHHTDHGM